jgi:hypothetical protein
MPSSPHGLTLKGFNCEEREPRVEKGIRNLGAADADILESHGAQAG